MKNKGFTILELLISIALISVILLLLLRVMMALESVNNDNNYASDDEIVRTEIIANIEQDFLDYNLNGLEIKKQKDKIVISLMMDEVKTIVIENNKLTYDNEKYILKSNKASYDTCINYLYQELENDYYLVILTIPVLIEGKNTTNKDDLQFTYIGLKNEFTNYPLKYNC